MQNILINKFKKTAFNNGINIESYSQRSSNVEIIIFKIINQDECCDEQFEIKTSLKDDFILFQSNKNKINEKHLINLVANRAHKRGIKIFEFNINKFIQNQILINSKNDDQIEILKYFLKYIKITKQFCVLTGDKLEFSANHYIISPKIDNKYLIDELPIGNYVVDTIKKNTEVARFILNTGFAAITSKRRDFIFEPFPSKFIDNTSDKTSDKTSDIKRGEISALIGKKINKNFDIIDVLISDCSVDKIIQISQDFVYDEDFSSKIGDDLFYLIRFLLLTNKTQIRKIDLFNDQISGNYVSQFIVEHPPETENLFKKEKEEGSVSCMLYHGSGYDNWYSIMRNGLKITSNTKLMTAGAVHGTGIYTSDTINFSLTYSKGSSDRIYNGKCIIAVMEVVGSREKYYKFPNIFVIPNEKLVILRYLFEINIDEFYKNKNDILCSKLFDNKFTFFSDKTTQIETKSRADNRCITRVFKEFNDCSKSKTLQENFIKIFIPNEENIVVWRVHLSQFDKDSSLQSDLDFLQKNNKNNFIELEIIFPDNFPMYPPFFRVVKPIFVYQTGHVTSGGSFCLDYLTRSGWSPATRIENILIALKTLIVDGGGRVDKNRINEIYSEFDARESYKRVANSHGWIV